MTRRAVRFIIRGAMEIDRDKFRELLLWVFSGLERAEKELLAHQATFVLLKASGEFGDLDQVLQKAREQATRGVEKKHEEIRELIHKLLDPANKDQALEQFLREWKPKGPVH